MPKMKLKEIIQMMELDDPRTSVQQNFDTAKECLLQLSNEYDQMGNMGVKALLDEMFEKLSNIQKNNRVFKQ